MLSAAINALKYFAGFFKTQTRIARKEFCVVAVPKIADEIGAPRSSTEKGRV
jgi:hypothetical protein